MEGTLRAGGTNIRKEIVPFIIDQNVSGKILHLNFPDGFHTKLGVFKHFHFFDIVLRQ